MCEMDGKVVRPSLVYFREFKFGSEAPGYPVLPYRISITHEELFAAFERYYNEVAEDDRMYGDETSDKAEIKLRELGWPALRDVVSGWPRIFEEFMYPSRCRDLLQVLFSPHIHDPSDYLINSVRLSVTPGTIEFVGDALEVRPQSASR